MPMLNYTTKIRPDRTASEIQRMLSKAGARAIMLNYEEGELAGLRFIIPTNFGEQAFTLPVKAESVHHVLRRQKGVAKGYQTLEHARSVAWRITKDWLEAQLAIIETEMVSLEQVMLPYMETGNGTVFEMVRDQQLALPAADVEA